MQRRKLFSFLHGQAGLVLHVNRRFAFLRRAHGKNLCTRADCRRKSIRRKHRKDEKRACRRLFNDLQKLILGNLRHGIFRKNAVDVDIRFLRLFVCVADDSSTDATEIVFDLPLPVTMRISGCEPAFARIHAGHTPQGAKSRFFACADRRAGQNRANVRLPSPASPCKRRVCGSLRRENAAESAVFRAAIPPQNLQTALNLLKTVYVQHENGMSRPR